MIESVVKKNFTRHSFLRIVRSIDHFVSTRVEHSLKLNIKINVYTKSEPYLNTFLAYVKFKE